MYINLYALCSFIFPYFATFFKDFLIIGTYQNLLQKVPFYCYIDDNFDDKMNTLPTKVIYAETYETIH